MVPRTRPARIRRIARPFAQAALLIGIAWAAGPAGADPFPHAPHLDEGIGCADCHAGSDAGPPALRREGCADCHGDEVPAFDATPRRRLEALFPHGRHADALDCKDCHAATMTGSGKRGTAGTSAADCFRCHADNGVDVPEWRCRACHAGDRRREAPRDHRTAWPERHGREAAWRVFDRHGTDCALCHAPSACTECHGSVRPRSHTALWRDRMHGPAASWDRDGCRTCHEPGSCVACHARTSPANHRGAWRALHGLAAGTRTSEECAACHATPWCTACHQGAR